MEWKAWARAAGWALVALAAIWLLLASYESSVVPRNAGQGQAERALLRAIEELERDATKTSTQVREIIDSICSNYPELRDEEVCRDDDEGR